MVWLLDLVPQVLELTLLAAVAGQSPTLHFLFGGGRGMGGICWGMNPGPCTFQPRTFQGRFESRNLNCQARGEGAQHSSLVNPHKCSWCALRGPTGATRRRYHCLSHTSSPRSLLLVGQNHELIHSPTLDGAGGAAQEQGRSLHA